MPEINYKNLEGHLQGLSKENFPPVCLIYGEEALYKAAFNAVLDLLLPASERSLSYEPVEGDNVHDAIARANTFSMLSGTKVIGLPDSRIFYSKQDDGALLEKAKAACEAREMKKAAKFFTSLMGIRKLSFDDVAEPDKRKKTLKPDPDLLGDGKWLDELIAYCTDKGLSPAAVQDAAGDLQKALEKGFPRGNHLIITTDMADKRRVLFKTIKKKGLIINCSVPKGSGKADQQARDIILRERMHSLLSKSGKRMDSRAYQTMCNMTGFDLRTFSNNLEKLVSYVGDRPMITAEDVLSVLRRTKQDPIYELTGALAERKADASLFFLGSLLAEGLFPLQILAAMINQMRKLLMGRAFLESPRGRAWRPGITYNQFQKEVVPAIQAYDQTLLSHLDAWEDQVAGDREDDEGKKSKKKKTVTDLLVAGNSKSPYPLYLLLQRAHRFTGEELFEIMECLGEADFKLKTSSQNPRLVLERVIFRICRQPERRPSGPCPHMNRPPHRGRQ